MTDLGNLELLYKALASPSGIIVQTADAQKTKAAFYIIRKAYGELQVLSFVTSPSAPHTELWIVHKPSDTFREFNDAIEK